MIKWGKAARVFSQLDKVVHYFILSQEQHGDLTRQGTEERVKEQDTIPYAARPKAEGSAEFLLIWV